MYFWGRVFEQIKQHQYIIYVVRFLHVFFW